MIQVSQGRWYSDQVVNSKNIAVVGDSIDVPPWRPMFYPVYTGSVVAGEGWGVLSLGRGLS